MSDAAWIALITGMPAILLALPTLILCIRNLWRTTSLEKRIDGQQEKLLELQASKSREEGVQAGHAGEAPGTAAQIVAANAPPPPTPGVIP